jgi:hypothetical protein
MTTGPLDHLSESELIEAHKLARRRLKRAKRLAIAAPLVLILALVTYVGFSACDFFRNKAPKVVAAVVKRSPEVVCPALSDAGESLKRLAPVYEKALADVWRRDAPIYQGLVDSQSKEFLEYTRGMQVRVVDDFRKIEGRILLNVEKHLTPTLLPEERREFEKAVAKTLYDRLNNEVKTHWDAQMRQVAGICQDFQKIALTTPDPQSKKPQYMIGVGLELLGDKLQEASK